MGNNASNVGPTHLHHHNGDEVAKPVPTRRGPIITPVLLAIRGYQRFVSPALPPACRYEPTCSVYGYEAIAKYGILKGSRLAIWRVLRCNPWGRGGFDPVD